MRALFLFVALCACGDNLHPARRDAGGSDAPIADAPDIDAPPQTLGHCLDGPGVLSPEMNAPSGALPCEMFPPAFTVSP